MDKYPDAFRTISEVAEDLDLPQHVLRFWETRFGQIKPLKRGGGRRYYRPDDVALLRGIRHLLYGEGYTIKGVQKILREQGPRYVGSLSLGAGSDLARLQPETSDRITETAQGHDGNEIPVRREPAFDSADDGEFEANEAESPVSDRVGGRAEPFLGVTEPLAGNVHPLERSAPRQLFAVPKPADTPSPTPPAPAAELVAAVEASLSEQTPAFTADMAAALREVLAELVECKRLLERA